jgi:probable F420-dependent oxidoreductase
MDLGFSFMNTPFDPPVVELAKALEERGYESLWTGEHSHIPVELKTPYPGGGKLPEPYKCMQDPYVTLTAAAAVTTTLKLGTGIALLLERDVFSQAKTISTLDRFSSGRLMIGTGVGWNEEGFNNISSLPWNKRYGILRETVGALRNLWTDDEAEFHGDYIDFDPVWCNPKPAQTGGPPIVFGAMGPLGLKHTAEWADGWMPVDLMLGDNIAGGIEKFRDRVKAAGRQPEDVEITLQTLITPDLDTFKKYRDMGIERVVIGVEMDGWDRPERIRPMIDKFAEFIPEIK